MIAQIDLAIRNLLSVCYRILIIGYCVSILVVYNNYFEWYIYLGIFILYSIIFSVCHGKEDKYRVLPYIRLLNDYALFYIILFDKTANNLHTLLLLVLPIINALNHSSKKKSGIFSIPMYLIALLAFFLISDFKFYWGNFLGLTAIGAINLFLYIRIRILNNIDRLNKTFEDYNIKHGADGKLHKLLKSLLLKFNDIPVILRSLLFAPKSIICFRIVNNKLSIKSSTKFVLFPEIENESNLIQLFSNTIIVYNHPIKLDEKNFEHNIWVRTNVNSNRYVFLFNLERNGKSKLNTYFMLKFLRSPLVKIAKIIDYENKIKGERRKLLNYYKDKFKQLEDTRDTLHLVKNKLLPVYTYFSLLNRAEERGKNYDDKITRTRSRIDQNLRTIKDRSKPFLEDQMNPDGTPRKVYFPLKELSVIIVESFQEEIDSKIKFKLKSFVGINRTAFLNREQLFFLLDEITMNVEKHSVANSLTLTLSFESDQMEINIENKFSKIEDKDLIVSLFNKEEVPLALENKYNGLTIVKRYLLKLAIKHHLTINGDMFNLKLEIQTYENSNL